MQDPYETEGGLRKVIQANVANSCVPSLDPVR